MQRTHFGNGVGYRVEKRARARTLALALAATLAASGCATVPTPTPGDPLEGWNRTVYKFNDKVDTYALKPVARGYVWAVPQFLRTGITNMFSNIGDVYIAANDLAQLKITDGVTDIMRVVMNTVFGVGGFFDIATPAKLDKHVADFGLTLGHYGVPPGPYLVLPLLGPSTVRDTAGLVVDAAGNPLTYIHPDWASWSVFGLNLVNTRANLLGAGDVLDAAALDKYSFVRNAYLQRRQMLSGGDGGSAQGALPDYSKEALPKYDMPDDQAASGTAAGAAAGAAAASGAVPAASGAVPAATAQGASAAAGTDEASSAAEAASPASSAAPNPASEIAVPGRNFVPPTPNGVHLPSFLLH